MKTFTLVVLFTFLFSGAYADSTWYHPNPWWKVARENTPVTKNAFEYRQALPQFGYPHRWTGEKWDDSDWKKWTEHNKISAPHRLAGHAWQVFIQQNAETLKKNPQFLAEVKGARLGYGKTAKLCVSNKDLQKLFIQNAIDRFEKQGDMEGYVSVEPSDGAGHCECSECKKMGSISNRVFYLANITAKAIQQKFPKGGVNLYAYYEHADTPSIRLEPNVHVTVIPNGFQELYDGDVLMHLWKKKTDNLSYYDYIAIPQWKGELPRIHIQNFLRRLEIAKKLKYRGFWHEVGFSLPATISIQLMSQLWRDPSLTWETVYTRFINDCFPNASVPMKRLFDRWLNEWNEKDEFSLAYADIREAEKGKLTRDEKKRLADIKAYTYYIGAYQRWRSNENENTTQQFFNQFYSIADKQLVNTSALFQLFKSKIKNPAVQQQYNIPLNKDWRWVRTLSNPEIDKKLASFSVPGNKLRPLGAKTAVALKSAPTATRPVPIAFKYIHTVVIKGTGKPINLSVRSVDFAISRDSLQYISIVSEGGDIIFSGLYPLEKDFVFASKKNLNYRLSVKQIFNSFLTIKSKDVKASIE